MPPTRSLLRALTATAVLAVTLPLTPVAGLAATVAPDAEDPQVRLVVRTDTRSAGRDVEAAVSREGARTSRRIGRLNALSLEVPSSRVAGLREQLLRRGDVTSVEVAHRRWLSEEPADPRFVEQRTYLDAVRAPEAWGRPAHGSADVRIAVIDSGVDVTHPDLASKIVGTYNAVNPGTGVRDLVGHGTGVASVAAAATGNGVGISGAGYDSSLLAVKVADRTGRIFTDDLAAGIVWAADSGADVINLSLGSPTSDALEKAAVEYAQRKGVLVVAAAGNEGTSTRQFPASLPGVLSVGATNTSGTARAGFSSFGSWVDVAAPGRSILIAAPGGGYEHADGTSFASPMVAGQVALLGAFRPGRSAAELSAAVTGAATNARFGFARGLVDFTASLDLLPPSTVPAITSPANGSSSSGVTTVTVASSAAKVRVGLADLTQVVGTSGGTATATFPTYGLAGPQTVSAADCSRIAQCNATAATATTTVVNGAPLLTSPGDGSTQAGDTVQVSADAPADAAVRFRIDGTNVSATDTSAPFAAALPLESVANGPHTVSATLCRRNATACDTANAARVTVTVGRLHPGITSVSATQLSPNGDGRNDTTTVRYRLEGRQVVTFRVRAADGRIVARQVLGAQSAGAHSVLWNGRGGGQVVPDGTYRVQVATSDGAQSGLASRAVLVDTRAPGVSGVSSSSPRVLPVRDDYLDRVALSATTSERARSVRLEVRSGSGGLVRAVQRTGVAPGSVELVWNGRDRAGRMVSPGSYTARFVVTDVAGNRRTSRATTWTLSSQRLVKRSGSVTVTARESLTESFFDQCSLVFRHTSGARKGWIGYYSSGTCDSGDAYAVADHQARLPAAVRYGSVQISARGGQGDPRFRDTARVVYHDRRQNVSEKQFRLGAALGTYTGPRVSAERHVIRKRVVRWSTYTTGVNWYDVESYTVRFTYFVLG